MIEINDDVTLTRDAMRDVAQTEPARGMLLTNQVESFMGSVIEIIGTSVLVLDRAGAIWNFKERDLIRMADYSPDFTESGNF